MQDLNGVLCDFGTVKPAAGAENDSRFSFGYADPFYVAHGIASEEVDIYSMGIIILQLVSQWEDVTVRQRPEDNSRIKKLKQWLGKEKDNSADEEEYNFVFWCEEKNKRKGHVVHERLISNGCSKKDARAITQLGLDCVHREQSVRPTIDQVIDVLQRLNQRRGCLAIF
ncbi:serine/threonine-protein kinase PBL35-like [Nicotiana sylvestris]|uniref:Receptor-like serine/threonine-protein kinase At3g01300 isoform X2 n=1 Tax=Nicotiana sylvestris TaxID=4096 RepID=A0A1U7XF88_NICSY|nr:PREDICTED: receptor-like serine/threonine-protein kinase At3g01300 isoform X2 [Nicotiana sylvestris]